MKPIGVYTISVGPEKVWQTQKMCTNCFKLDKYNKQGDILLEHGFTKKIDQ